MRAATVLAVAAAAAALCSSAEAATNATTTEEPTAFPTAAPTGPSGTLTAFGGDFEVEYELITDSAVRMVMRYPMTAGWMGIGISDDGDMIGTRAVIGGSGVSNLPANVGEYRLTAYEKPSLYSGVRSISATSVTVEDGVMEVSFTADGIAGRDLDIDGDGDRLVFAIYKGSSFGNQHAKTGSASVNWSSPVPSSAGRLPAAYAALSLCLAAAFAGLF